MKKIGDLMKEMGFNENASQVSKEAFIKHLIKAATGNDVITPTEKKIIQDNPDKIVIFPNQLSFSFYDEGLTASDEGPEKNQTRFKKSRKL